VTKLVGVEVRRTRRAPILERLGFGVSDGAAGEWQVAVPYWRENDVYREADLIEEIARVYGLDKVPTTLPSRRAAIGRLTPDQKLVRRLEDELRDHGLYEVIAWSMTAPETLAKLRLGGLPALRLANAMSEELSLNAGRCCCRGCWMRRATTPRAGAPTSRCSSPRTCIALDSLEGAIDPPKPGGRVRVGRAPSPRRAD